ncbi:MAG: carboxylesterase family protein [Bifidobacterium sp.]|jgi:para-nitrobenzyl esterase|nr:carboxylesterase family protein [Bifidobacterium sp.]
MQVPYYDVPALAPVVETTRGSVQGRWQNASSAAYLGIPFAAPPVGDLRFAAPERFPVWSGVRPALEYGPTAQRRPFGPVVTIPEPSICGDSTLNVNVFTPAPRDRRAHLPVLVWIHGGGYFAGSPSSPWYNGRSFNADGIVTVSISYRLGFDGFGWMRDAPLNRGLLDQIAALTWVNENIEEFGGDPSKVTIAGQSAGGGSALALLGSRKASGLFRGAISESGAFGGPDAWQAEEVGRSLASVIGVEPTAEAWRGVDQNVILDHERAVNVIADAPASLSSVDDMVKAINDGFIGSVNLAYAPTIDGDVITQSEYDAYASGQGGEVSLLMGSTHNEFAFPMDTDTTLEEDEDQLRAAGISDRAAAQFIEEIHRIGPDRIAGQLNTIFMFRVGIAKAASARNAAGAGDRTWLYDFGQSSAVSNCSVHCDDIPYFFDLLDAPKVSEVLGDHPSEPLAKKMHGTWVEFISHGGLGAHPTSEFPCGALRFLGGARFDPDAYALEAELISMGKHEAPTV